MSKIDQFFQLPSALGHDLYGHTDGHRQWVISRDQKTGECRASYKGHPNGKTHWLNDQKPFDTIEGAIIACLDHKKKMTQ